MSQHGQKFLALVDDAKKRVPEISIQAVREKQTRGEAFYLVDTREDEEWNAGFAKGAIHLGKGVIERDIESEIPNLNAEIVLYCGGGFRSALAGDMLLKMGYTRVLSMAGGIRAWKEAGYPIDQEKK